MAQLGIAISPFAISVPQLTALSLEAERANYSGVYISEGNNDVLMCCYAVAQTTERIGISSWIANVYFRQPNLCAAGAAMVQDASDGRFTLGLGVSHRFTLGGLQIEMGNARDRLRSYTATVRRMLRGEPVSAQFPMRLRAAPKPVPIYYGALTVETARAAGETADGVMLYLCWPDRMRRQAAATRSAATAAGRRPEDVAITVGLPSFVSENREKALQAARAALGFYVSLPFFNRILSRSGFEAEAIAVGGAAKLGDFSAMGAALSERLLDSLALVGPASHCIERLNEYRAAGGELPIIVPNAVDEDYVSCVRRNIHIFRRAI